MKVRITIFALALLAAIPLLTTGSLIAQRYLAAARGREEAFRIKKTCEAAPGAHACYRDVFSQLTRQRTLEEAVKTLAALEKLDPQNAADCHSIAHAISIEETEKNPSRWLDVFSRVDPNACGRGFYHGIIEAHYQNDPSFILNERTIPEICARIAERDDDHMRGEPLEEGICGHEFGHLLLVQEEGNLSRATEICAKTPDAMQNECFRGTFMESIDRDNLSVHGLGTPLAWDEQTAEKITSLCLTYSGPAATGCWEALAHIFAKISGHEPEKIYEKCRHAPEPADTHTCHRRGAGFMAIAWAQNGIELRDPAALCEPLAHEPDQFISCAHTVVLYLIDASPLFASHAVQFCRSIARWSLDERCYETTKTYLRNFASSEQLKEICATQDKNLARVCDAVWNRISLAHLIFSSWKKGILAAGSFIGIFH